MERELSLTSRVSRQPSSKKDVLKWRWHQFTLLMWKNLLLRKRHYILTVVELILPCLLTIILARMRAQRTEYQVYHITDTIFPPIHEDLLLSEMGRVRREKEILALAYAPTNAFTNRLMGIFKEQLVTWDISAYGFTSFDWEMNKVHKLANMTIAHTYSNGTWEIFPKKTEQDLESFGVEATFFRSPRPQRLIGTILFKELPKNGTVPKKLSYVLRFNPANWRTDKKFTSLRIPPNALWDSAITYCREHFTAVQLLIDRAFITMVSKSPPKYKIIFQLFPFPTDKARPPLDFHIFFAIFLPNFLVFGFIFLCPSVINGVVQEKESGMTEFFKMVGIPQWLNLLAWLFNVLVTILVSITLVVILLVTDFSGGEGSVLENINPGIVWMLLFLYTVSCTAFCFTVSAFFNVSSMATAAGMTLWILGYLAPALTLLPKYVSSTYSMKMLTGLSPHAALAEGLIIFAIYEENWEYLGWSRLTKVGRVLTPEGERPDNFRLVDVFVMLTVDTFIYLFVAIYVSSVMPGGYGVTKPWYFIFTPCAGFFKIKTRRVSDPSINVGGSGPNFEDEPNHLPVDITILGLRKVFSTFRGQRQVAVRNVSLNVFRGQITVLLGHSGAGKSTLLNTLVGLYGPTEGTAFVCGLSIGTDLRKAQRKIGFCPQHNMLLEDLTVMEHLVFFGMLKYLPLSIANKQSELLVEKLRFEEKKHSLAFNLSGGQKRKLCLGIALIGDPHVLILDEPTSGMDPEARRAVWDLLLELRSQYSILLTTQVMEEADVLGDRIAIMVHGNISCCGSPHFLKKTFEMGYHLALTMKNTCSESQVTDFIRSYISQAELQSITGSELKYRLPRENSELFLNLFENLEIEKKRLGINSFGISLTTMDDVFMRVIEKAVSKMKISFEDVGNVFTLQSRKSVSVEEKFRGFRLHMQRLRALLLKCILNMKRRWPMYLGQMCIVLLLTLSCIMLSNTSVDRFKEPHRPRLECDLGQYGESRVLYRSSGQAWAETLAAEYARGLSGVRSRQLPPDTLLKDALLKEGNSNQTRYKNEFVVAADFWEEDWAVAEADFSAFAVHSAAVSLNLVDNALLRHYAGDGYSIRTANHPLPTVDKPQATYQFSSAANKLLNSSVMFSIFMTIGLSLLATGFLIFPAQENISSAKQLQLMTGMSPLIYWGVLLLLDMFFVFFTHMLVLVIFYFMDTYGTYINYKGLGSLFYILITFGWSSVAFSYLVSIFSKSVSGGLGLVSLLHIVSGTIFCYIVRTLEESEDDVWIANMLRWIFQAFPAFLVSYGLLRFSQVATKNNRCNYFDEAFKKKTCSIDFSNILMEDTSAIARSAYSCCENMCTSLNACSEAIHYLSWNIDENWLKPTPLSSPSAASANSSSEPRMLPGSGQCTFYMFVLGMAYLFLLLLLESRLVGRLALRLLSCGGQKQKSSSQQEKSPLEEDVRAEKKLVETMDEESSQEYALVVKDLAKSFGSFVAVNGLSFRVNQYECFGLLGVNGAGKTTTFRMLTGDQIPSRGNAYLSQLSLNTHTSQFLQNIGYCPQFDGLVDTLTGKEMMELFARLRGVPWRLVPEEVDKWIRYMGLQDCSEEECGMYSAGTKRKLSTAMALVGDSPLVLLDEPTSGMDPGARRMLWKALANIQKLGQAVVLTSHSMEECESLCQRVAIMVNGQLQCLGGPVHLKNKFGQGFTVLVKLRQGLLEDNPQDLIDLKAEIEEKLKPCVLKDYNQTLLNYHVTDPQISWPTLFRQMEHLKTHWELVEDYSVGETTLEQIFLVFAKGQRDAKSRGTPMPLLQRILRNMMCCQGL